MIHLLQPPGDPSRISGGYRYNTEIGRRLAATGLGTLEDHGPKELAAGPEALLRADPEDVLVFDSLYLSRIDPPAWLKGQRHRTRVLLHYLPSLNPLLRPDERERLERRERAWTLAVGGVLTTSSHLAVVVLGTLGVEAQVATPGVSGCFRAKAAEDPPEQAAGTADAVTVVGVGPIRAEKGQLSIARAVAASAAASPGRVHRLVLIGDQEVDPGYTEAVRAAAVGVELTFTGSLPPDGVAERLREASLFVSASVFESYGMAIAEAAATGTPIVSYRAGEVDRWVEDGENGYLLEPGDEESLTRLLVRLLASDELEALRTRGRKLFFPSWEYTFKRFLRGCRVVPGSRAASELEAPTLYSTCDLPTRYGTFAVKVYRLEEGEEAILISMGDLTAGGPPFVRVHSECFTGEILHSLKCDCRLQLEVAMQAVAERRRGAVVYLRQEGRGIGLGNKIRAYAEQSKGANTVEANERLGFPADLREFRVAAQILKLEGIERIHLNTNNPDKVTSLEAHGIRVERVVPSRTTTNPHNVDYLLTKFRALGHEGLEDALQAEGVEEPVPPEGTAARVVRVAGPGELAGLEPDRTLLVVDLDGVVKLDSGIPREARELLERLRAAGYTIRFLTNDGINSRRTRLAESARDGLELQPEELYTASYLTARWLREQRPGPILPLFGTPATEEFEDIPVSLDAPRTVVVGDYFPHYDYEAVKAAHVALEAGAELVAMHRKRTWPTGGGRVIDIGFWVAGLEYCAGRPAHVIGKPGPFGYRAVLEDAGFAPENAVMISDEEDPDLAGARALGLHTVCFAGTSPEATATAGSYAELAGLLGLDR